jgi:hypothetical protein
MSFGNKDFSTAIPRGIEVEILLLFTAKHFGDLEILLLSTADFLDNWKYFYFLPQTFWLVRNTSTSYRTKISNFADPWTLIIAYRNI